MVIRKAENRVLAKSFAKLPGTTGPLDPRPCRKSGSLLGSLRDNADLNRQLIDLEVDSLAAQSRVRRRTDVAVASSPQTTTDAVEASAAAADAGATQELVI